MFDITYNNLKPSNFNAWLATIPIITPSSITRTRQSVPRMDGELLLDDESYNDAYVDFIIHARRDDLVAKMRQIKKWLSGTGRLVISDAPDAFYEVKQVTFSSYIKKDETYGRLAVKMEVYPYEFLNTGETYITSPSSISNDAEESKPLYTITGTGDGVLSVNGHTMSFSLGSSSSELNIDTRRKVAYNGSGTGKDGAINGDYEGLYLKPGNNVISCTAGTLKVKPRWGYRV